MAKAGGAGTKQGKSGRKGPRQAFLEQNSHKAPEKIMYDLRTILDMKKETAARLAARFFFRKKEFGKALIFYKDAREYEMAGLIIMEKLGLEKKKQSEELSGIYIQALRDYKAGGLEEWEYPKILKGLFNMEIIMRQHGAEFTKEVGKAIGKMKKGREF
ncbi:MAG: hypothetical protein ABH854_05720 [Candidatus Diapherotrites archaeon]|nr:hypothetical protein [Candidatus Micrarchaeota archaeon]